MYFRLLTGISIKSKEDVLEAMNIFHRKGVKTVVISSVQLQSSDKLQLYGSTIKGIFIYNLYKIYMPPKGHTISKF